MDFKVNRETILVAECVYDGVSEQGLEIDYILPDYYPDVFKLVKSEVTPIITDYSINGGRLTYELRCDIRILYCSENGSVLQCVTQKQTHSKSLDLGQLCENPTVMLKPKCDYINCRAVNKRRLDLRGAVSVKVKVIGEKKQEVISDIFGMNVQLKKTPVQFTSKKVVSRKLVQLNEEIELNTAMPSVLSIARCECTSVTCEKKAISGKLLAKGEASVNILYSCEKEGAGGLEPMEFSVSYSQLIDADGDDSYDCQVKPEVLYCDITPVQSRDGESRVLKCELEIQLVCSSIKTTTVELGLDAYSTTHPCSTASTKITAEKIPSVRNYDINHSSKICEGEDLPTKIYSMRCTPKNVNARLVPEEKKLCLSGMLTYSMAARDSSGMIVMPDKEEAFEESFDIDDEFLNSECSAEISVRGVSYTISPENVLTAKAEIGAEVSLSAASEINVLADVIVDGSTKKVRDGDYAIKLYYGAENEDVWEIAKRYSTCISAINEENELSGERLEQSGMLIIPIINA